MSATSPLRFLAGAVLLVSLLIVPACQSTESNTAQARAGPQERPARGLRFQIETEGDPFIAER